MQYKKIDVKNTALTAKMMLVITADTVWLCWRNERRIEKAMDLREYKSINKNDLKGVR